MDLPEFGQKLKEARNSRGITLRQLSARCGLSPATLSRLENGFFSGSLYGVHSALGALGMEMTVRQKGGNSDVYMGEYVADDEDGQAVFSLRDLRWAVIKDYAGFHTLEIVYHDGKELQIVYGEGEDAYESCREMLQIVADNLAPREEPK